MLIADILVNIPLKKDAVFSYLIPEDFSFLKKGWRVVVPFGQRMAEGFIYNIKEDDITKLSYSIKPIAKVVDDSPWFSELMMKEAQWISDFYLCTLPDAMRLFIPGKSGVKIKSLSGSSGSFEIQNRISKKVKRLITLSSPIDEQTLFAFKNKKAQKKLLEYLDKNNSVGQENLIQLGFSRQTINNLEKTGFIKIIEQRDFRDTYSNLYLPENNHILTPEQQTVFLSLKDAAEKREAGKFLLHGVTGSGKTRVYIEIVKYVRSLNRQAIILVPEIALTGQMIVAFKQYFSNDIVVLHSRLSVAERNDAIERIKCNEAGIVIGARSALFVPFDNIGIIILDEEQDMSYKQEEHPAYHCTTVAEAFSEIHGAVLLLGSATPSTVSYYKAEQNIYHLLEMPHRIDNRSLPSVTITDMRKELREGNRHVISRDLQRLLVSTMSRKEQAIIMLNRRGYSTFVMCRLCGNVLKCRQCGLPLVYHADGTLKCHFCDLHSTTPDVCPNCSSRYIKFFGTGTEKLEQELKELLPEAKIVRMDRDTTGRKDSHTNILNDVKNHKYDILLGTQMVAKGHDIPNVTAVGVISADAALNIPDYRSAERCFMLITQTAGRAGRGDLPGQVIVQTYNTEHYSVVSAQKQDYKAFYKHELEYRKKLNFPPFCHIIKLVVRHKNEETAKSIAKSVQKNFNLFCKRENDEIIGPVPASVAKLREFYRYCLLIKTNNILSVKSFLKKMEYNMSKEIMIDIDPISIN